MMRACTGIGFRAHYRPMTRFPLLFACVGLALFYPPLLAGVYAPTQSPHVDILSPEVPQTWAYYQLGRRTWQWDDSSGTLSVQVEFMTGSYGDETSPRSLDRQVVTFPFPGVTFNPGTGIFSATSSQGQSIPLLQRQDQALGPRIILLPTSRISLINFSGKITAILSGTTDPSYATGGSKWITENHGWYLQNLMQ
jgi:hypothetical protein